MKKATCNKIIIVRQEEFLAIRSEKKLEYEPMKGLDNLFDFDTINKSN
jgi:hypothetical protein